MKRTARDRKVCRQGLTRGMRKDVLGEGLAVPSLRGRRRGGAYSSFEEDRKGSIEVGKLAELVVLSDHPLTVEEVLIPDLVAEMTVVGGRVVFERAAAAPGLR